MVSSRMGKLAIFPRYAVSEAAGYLGKRSVTFLLRCQNSWLPSILSSVEELNFGFEEEVSQKERVRYPPIPTSLQEPRPPASLTW